MLPGSSELDRTQLHVFVAGPGRGEGIAVAFPAPDYGWMLIDGCKIARGRFPLHRVYERYRVDDNDALEAVLITHPHDDHVDGVVELLDRWQPRSLGCVATHHRPAENSLVAELIARREDPHIDEDPALKLALRRVKTVLARIQDSWDRGISKPLLLQSGLKLLDGRKGLTCEVVAPNAEGIKRFFKQPKLPERIRKRANELSAVVHITFGDTRVLLGSDLPETDFNVGQRTGWSKVLKQHRGLPGSICFKIPHHGSDGAMHPMLTGAGVAPPNAAWVLTPFQGGEKKPLPHLRKKRGVAALLSSIETVHLSSLPGGWVTTRPVASTPVPIDQVVPVSAPLASRPGATTRSLEQRHRARDELDPIWLFAFSSTNTLTTKWRGDVAIEIRRVVSKAARGGTRSNDKSQAKRGRPGRKRTSRSKGRQAKRGGKIVPSKKKR